MDPSLTDEESCLHVRLESMTPQELQAWAIADGVDPELIKQAVIALVFENRSWPRSFSRLAEDVGNRPQSRGTSSTPSSSSPVSLAATTAASPSVESSSKLRRSLQSAQSLDNMARQHSIESSDDSLVPKAPTDPQTRGSGFNSRRKHHQEVIERKPREEAAEQGLSMIPTSPLGTSAPLRFSPNARPRRCKFGCGRLVEQNQQGAYSVCCQDCGANEGSSINDDTGSSSEDAQVAAIMAVDRVLELRRRAKAFEAKHDVARAQVLLKDGASQLEQACSKLPRGSRTAILCKSVLAAWHSSDFSQEDNVLMLEKLIAAEVDRLIGELGNAHQKGFTSTEGVVDDAGSQVPRIAENSTDLALTSRFSTPTKATFPELSPISPSTGSASGSGSERKQAGASSADKSGSSRKPKASSRGSNATSCHPAQAALRILHLDHEWPTDLTMGEVRRRYMREALQSHPDKGPPSEKAWRTARFQEISNAYSSLETYIAALERVRGPGPSPKAEGPQPPRSAKFERSGSREQKEGPIKELGILSQQQDACMRLTNHALPPGACGVPVVDLPEAVSLRALA